jgi:hypothetical protein
MLSESNAVGVSLRNGESEKYLPIATTMPLTTRLRALRVKMAVKMRKEDEIYMGCRVYEVGLQRSRFGLLEFH